MQPDGVRPGWSDTPPAVLGPVQGPQIVYEPVSKTEKHHRQRLGETWQDFFHRRQEGDELRKQTETEQSREKRLQREAHAAKFKIPGAKGGSGVRVDARRGQRLSGSTTCLSRTGGGCLDAVQGHPAPVRLVSS